MNFFYSTWSHENNYTRYQTFVHSLNRHSISIHVSGRPKLLKLYWNATGMLLLLQEQVWVRHLPFGWLHSSSGYYGNTGNLTLQMHSIWWEITVAVLFTVVLCQALWSVSKWTVQIWNLHKNTYESLGRRLDSSREEFFISNKKAKITI